MQTLSAQNYLLRLAQQVEIIELESNPEGPFTLYGIRFVGENLSEFEKFHSTYSAETKAVRGNFYRIMVYIENIIRRGQALERDFRYEGKIDDRLCALPTEYGKLRLFCLRVSEHVLILGNGGIKTTRTYQENTTLNAHAEVLQKVDKELRIQEERGIVKITPNGIADCGKVIVNI